MRMLVVGAGSIGGYFGGRLLAAERDVAFLVRPARKEALEKDGLVIQSTRGDLKLQPKGLTKGELNEPFGVVFLAVKGSGVEQAISDMAPAVGPSTMILPALNGMRHMDLLASRFGNASLMGCAVKVSTELDAAGHVVHTGQLADLAFGELDGQRTDRASALETFLHVPGFEARLSDDITQEMWEKWVFLASLGAMTCLLRGTTGDINASDFGPSLMKDIVLETARAIEVVGVKPRQAMVDNLLKALASGTGPQTSSMYRDLAAGHAVEADQILGDLLNRLPDPTLYPLLRAAYVQLSIYQRQLRPH